MSTISLLIEGVSGDGPEGGVGSGVPRLRLVTVVSEGRGPRPPGTTTWLRGARCTDREAMPEMEARPPAQNRHGGPADAKAMAGSLARRSFSEGGWSAERRASLR